MYRLVVVIEGRVRHLLLESLPQPLQVVAELAAPHLGWAHHAAQRVLQVHRDRMVQEVSVSRRQERACSQSASDVVLCRPLQEKVVAKAHLLFGPRGSTVSGRQTYRNWYSFPLWGL